MNILIAAAASLKRGSRTNCGIVIAFRETLVQVQLPFNIAGPGKAREFRVPRQEPTGEAALAEGRFGG